MSWKAQNMTSKKTAAGEYLDLKTRNRLARSRIFYIFFALLYIDIGIPVMFQKTCLLASPVVMKGYGTNSISTMMLPYLGHDITSRSLSNPPVADAE